MIASIAVVPQPPMAVPEVSGDAAGDLAPLRAAVLRALRDGLRGCTRAIVLAAQDGPERIIRPPATATLAPWGIDVRCPLDPAAAGPSDPSLPLALAMGAWWLAESGWAGSREAWLIPQSLEVPGCRELGFRLETAAHDEPTLLLVVGDGSARRSARAPGHLDRRAHGFDVRVSRALESGDPEALLALDPQEAAELMVSGLVGWRVAASVAAAAIARGATWSPSLRYDDAHLGVAYPVALWRRLPA